MDPALRELLDHSTFHQGAAQAVAALLPPDDDALAALLDETCAAADPLGFLLVMSAALDAGRTVDAACLRRGLGFCMDANRLGCFAWKMPGDVPAALLAALAQSRYSHELHAGALFVVAAWCAERRGGELPAGFAANARLLARTKDLSSQALIHLHAAAILAEDEGVLAVMRQRDAPGVWEATLPAAETFARALLKVFAEPALALIPAEPPRAVTHQRPVQRAVEKLGRNDPCHCLSGKKYKRCCFDKDRERLQFSSEVAGMTHPELRAAPETALTEARLKAMHPLELTRLDPRKIPYDLRTTYIMQCTGLALIERAVEFVEITPWQDDEDLRNAVSFLSFFLLREQRRDLVARLFAAPCVARLDPPCQPREGLRLLLARDDPAAELTVLDDIARKILHETDPEELSSLGYDVLCSRHPELGLVVCRSLIATLPRTQANFLLKVLLEARDRLGLSPDDPFSDLLEKRLAEETSDEGKDAAALRAARQRLDAKAAEVRALKEAIEDQRRRLDRQERAQKAAPPPSASSAPTAPRAPEEDAALREMRAKLAALKGTLGERAAERVTLRHALEKAREDLEALRQGGGAPGPVASEGSAVDEAAFYLPEQPAGNQPLRLVEYPPRFRETLDELPRQAARGALAMLGRLAGGEPAAFVGVVQLKACHGVLRQRVGSEHRLLFRLLPDRVQAVDFINRRDLDRTVKRLRVAR